MKYFFNIDDRDFTNVSDIQISKNYRSENSFNNLSGDLLIDRIGEEKTDLSVKVNLLSEDDMQFLRNCRSKMEITAKYYEGNLLNTKKMYIKPFIEPSPIYSYKGEQKKIIYKTLTLKLTEL